MSKNDYFFFNTHKDLDSAIQMISSYINGNSSDKLSCAGLFLKKDLKEIFGRYSPEKFNHTFEEINESVFKISVTKRYKMNGIWKIKEGKALFLKLDPSFCVIVCKENLDIFKSVILQFLSYYYIESSRAFLNSKDLKELIQLLQQKTNGKIITNRIVAYERKSDNGKNNLKKSAIIYTKENYEDSFEYAIDKDQFIDKIEFTLKKEKDKSFVDILNGFISREGLFRVDSNFSLFFDSIIQGYKKIALSNFKMFANRQRTKNEEFEVKPLEITYNTEIFHDMSNNKRLINVLSKMKHSTLSCYHCNPYINLSILDYLDGSSADLWVIDTSKIIIIPQSKCSQNFLSRFVNFLFENFREGKLQDFKGDTIV